MPRIAAETVAAHVAQQEAAVIEATSRLAAERGWAAVSLGDIAAEVGLARTSLYRYFPDKDHLLAAWFRRELEPLADQAARILAGGGGATDRLLAWMDLQLGYLTAPEHRALVVAVDEAPALSEDVRADIAEGHRRLYQGAGTAVAEALEEHRARGRRRRDAHTVTMLLVGVLRACADLVEDGAPERTVRDELQRCARAVLAAAR